MQSSGQTLSQTFSQALSHFGLTEAIPLAQGTQARVYALDETRVLKLYADTVPLSHLQSLKSLYDHLDATATPIRLPRILDLMQFGHTVAAVEQRLAGTPLEKLLPSLTPQQLDQAEAVYLDTVAQVAKIPFLGKRHSYTVFETPDSVITPTSSFELFYANRLATKLTEVASVLAQVDPQLPSQLRTLIDVMGQLRSQPLVLVHGDIWPGNILMNGIQPHPVGVIDFGLFSLWGNPLIDWAGAFSYYQMYAPDRVAIRKRLLPNVLDRLTNAERPLFFHYLLANALLTSNHYIVDGDYRDGHFQWAVELLCTPDYWQQAGL